MFIESGVLPLILFYSLEWGAYLSMQTNLAIITSLVATVGGGNWGVDTFHTWIVLALTGYFTPLIVGSSL